MPAIVWAILELIIEASAAYEAYDLAKTLYDDVTKYESNLEEAKKQIRSLMQSLQDEVNNSIDHKYEPQLLARLSDADARKFQSEVTRKVQGPLGEGSELIKTAIRMPMPFRRQLTQICDIANKTPVLSLRRKRGVEIKDLPQAKKKILMELLALSAEELADIDLDAFIVVRLKQLVVSHMIEFADDLLDWKSPMKAEACFGPRFENPPVQGTRITRLGGKRNPFYPMPYKRKGTIAADVAIPDYRHEPLSKTNLFGIVEIKFPGDTIRDKQFKGYDRLSKACAKAKTSHVGKARTLEAKGVTLGARVSLFRYPWDRIRQTGGSSDSKPTHTSRKKGGGKL
jgi:polyhydroxyalkanoate synthesis regulator phasin